MPDVCSYRVLRILAVDRFRGSCQLRWLGLGCVCHVARISYLMSADWRSICVGLEMFAVCRRLRISHFLQIVWILVLLKKLIAEVYVQRALKNLGMKVFKITANFRGIRVLTHVLKKKIAGTLKNYKLIIILYECTRISKC